MKKSLLLGMCAAVLLIAPSCNKQKAQWSKHVITEEYVFVDPCDDPEAAVPAEDAKAKTKCLWKMCAKKMLKNHLEATEIINTPITYPVQLGYYECNSLSAREDLYKLQVNGLVNVKYSEIKNKYEQPTYWVEVALTEAGKKLVVVDDTPVFPEDTINPLHMMGRVSPETGLNQYGEYTFDPNVDGEIVALLQSFYSAYIVNGDAAIDMYATRDLKDARDRINKAKKYSIRTLTSDPFLRSAELTAEDVAKLTVTKWTTYVDLYIVAVGGYEYCVVVKDVCGEPKVDDVALNTPKKLVLDNTMRCAAKKISGKELYFASKYNTPKNIKSKKVKVIYEVNEWDYEEYKPELQPGIVAVERTEPTPYQIAKLAENYQIVNLYAGELVFNKLSKIKDCKVFCVEDLLAYAEMVDWSEYVDLEKVFVKQAKVTVEYVNVSALGRIFYGYEEGEKRTADVLFVHADGEWRCYVD